MKTYKNNEVSKKSELNASASSSIKLLYKCFVQQITRKLNNTCFVIYIVNYTLQCVISVSMEMMIIY